MSDPNDKSDATCGLIEGNFEVARFPIRLPLPEADASLLDDAKEAVRREFRDSVQWKRLRCRGVTLLSDTAGGSVFVLEVGHAVEFDWTWEGAVAFRPLVLKEFAERPESAFGGGADAVEVEDSILWAGEVVEVDEASGRIFVSVPDPEHPPTTGSFYVRPFEFLASLNAVFNAPPFDEVRRLLPARLSAAEGGVHPYVDARRAVGLEHLHPWWAKGWSILWGPPGTGKTYTTGQQVARVLADPTERVLVVSTTNRATDAAALHDPDLE